MSTVFNIYMSGVGGQGIGLLAELLARAADHAGLVLRACAGRRMVVVDMVNSGVVWAM